MLTSIPNPERAITVHRPWDQAILRGGKTVENRSWPLYERMIGVPIAIHAGKRYDAAGASWMQGMDLYRAPADERSPTGLVGAVVFDRVIHEARCDGDPEDSNPWFTGPWGWVVRAVAILEHPVQCKGAQGLWTIPDELRGQMLFSRWRAADRRWPDGR